MNLNGKIALITGASVGIGRAAALLMAEYGADVIMLDINYEQLCNVEKELAAFGHRTAVYNCDISDENRVNEVIADAIAKFGRIDILVNNAALWRYRSSFVDSDTNEWRKLFDINVLGTVYVTKAVLPSMIENAYGRIINVASVAGVYGNANMVAYSSTKGAVISMTKGLAKEVAAKGITVNAVSPGSVSPSDNHDIDFTKPSELSFMGRTGSDRENAELICFIASDAAGYISGQNIQIDGCRKKM